MLKLIKKKEIENPVKLVKGSSIGNEPKNPKRITFAKIIVNTNLLNQESHLVIVSTFANPF